MKNKNSLKNLSKLELLELLAEQEAEIEQLKRQLVQKDRIIRQRTLCMEQAGNIAQAALVLNGVFEAAQKAADQYVESVKMMAAQQVKAAETLPNTVRKPEKIQKAPQHQKCTINRSLTEKNITAEEILQSLNKNKNLQQAAAPKAPNRAAAQHEQEGRK